jgi:uncharacterized protein YutE (UPF0331/DUF86 family)
MINGVIINKLQAMEEVITELRSLGKITTQMLEKNWQSRKAVERNLQVMVEVVIDVCQRIISLARQIPATTSADAVERCIKLGALSEKEAYKKMVQFRNFIVHRYEKIDVEILVDIVNNHLQDFETFRDEVLAYAKAQP